MCDAAACSAMTFGLPLVQVDALWALSAFLATLLQARTASRSSEPPKKEEVTDETATKTACLEPGAGARGADWGAGVAGAPASLGRVCGVARRDTLDRRKRLVSERPIVAARGLGVGGGPAVRRGRVAVAVVQPERAVRPELAAPSRKTSTITSRCSPRVAPGPSCARTPQSRSPQYGGLVTTQWTEPSASVASCSRTSPLRMRAITPAAARYRVRATGPGQRTPRQERAHAHLRVVPGIGPPPRAISAKRRISGGLGEEVAGTDFVASHSKLNLAHFIE